MNSSTLKSIPEWFVHGNIYQINPRTFSSEGTLNAITAELPFLHGLGVKILYLCPIFRADDSLSNLSKRQMASGTQNPKNPYRMNDFFEIDEEYGTMAELARLISEAHRLDMRVLLDLVYFHIGPNADILKTHPEFAKRTEDGELALGAWNFPVLNYENGGLREYLWSNMTYYIGKLDADGFRCDVGDAVPLDFWQEGKRRIREIKPDAVMINEGSKWEYLEKCFDASYSFYWHSVVYKVLTGAVKASEIREKELSERKKGAASGILMRDLDNHDTVTDLPARAEAAAGHDGMELATALNYTIDGIPMIYCGNELCDTARLNMFANRFYTGGYEFTDRSNRTEPHSIRRQMVLKRLNALRAESDVLCRGETVWLETGNENVIAFERRLGGDALMFIGNFTAESQTARICQNGAEVVLQSEAPAEFMSNCTVLPKYGYAVIRL